MSLPSVADVPGLWSPDGSLRDVYFVGTSPAHWEKFVWFIQSYRHKYTYDGRITPLPSIESIFANREGSHLLSVVVCGVTINCHFFIPEEIEIDIEPREVKGRKEHDAILKFIASLSQTVGKPALLTPENCVDIPFLSFEPENHAWVIYD